MTGFVVQGHICYATKMTAHVHKLYVFIFSLLIISGLHHSFQADWYFIGIDLNWISWDVF